MSKSRSKSSLSLSPSLSRHTMTTPTFTPTHVTPFGTRRGNVRFSSGRFNISRSSARSRKGSLLSFRSTKRGAARPNRTRGIFDSLLLALADGVEAVRGCVGDMKAKLPDGSSSGSRMNYYMDLEKQIKALERKIRTLEVHKDRIEEMRDEYLLKLKLREGAFNLAVALSSQSSKAAKEKLQETRAEQKDLLEDLCDIEDELETKLGVFTVHINGLVGLGRPSSGDQFETQLKLGTQKWKARCKISRQQQMWQDAHIIFLGKIADELYVKVVELRRIQGNAHVGSMKCQTRELLSFFPLNVTFNFPSSSTKLNMDVRWSPMLGDDFLADLDLHTIHCLVGGHGSKLASRPSSMGNVERLHQYPHEPLISGLNMDTNVHQIRIITEPDDSESHSSNSYGRTEVKTHNICHRPKKPNKKKNESDFVYFDRQSMGNMEEIRDFPEAKQYLEKEEDFSVRKTPYQTQVKESCSHDSFGSSSGSSGYSQQKSPECITLFSMVEAVMSAMEEPRDLYPDLRALDIQLSRLEAGIKSGKLTKTPSMTLSENQAMDSFDFLGYDDALLLPRYSRASFSELPEGFFHRRSGSAGTDPMSSPKKSTSHAHPSHRGDFHQASIDSQKSTSHAHPSHRGDFHQASIDSQKSTSHAHPSLGGDFHQASIDSQKSTSHAHPSLGGDFHQASIDSQPDEVFTSISSSSVPTGSQQEGTTGVPSVDRALIQHLIHCEYLLQNLQCAGPLNFKLTCALRKLQQEAEIIAELLNIAAEPSTPPKMEHILPELAASEQLMRFWRSVTRDDMLSVSYEQFAVALDKGFGQGIWNDFPEVANKVFSELLGRVLDLDMEEYGPAESMLVVTVYQYASYFISQGGGILKCMIEVAQELGITEGLDSSDREVRRGIASQLLEFSYNRGALLAAAHLLADPSSSLQRAAGKYLQKFAGNSPWHTKAVQYYIELLEHTDQAVRLGACTALGKLESKSAVHQLKYLAKSDFGPVRVAASKALVMLGERDPSTQTLDIDGGSSKNSSMNKKSSTRSLLTPETEKKKPLQRTRSAESPFFSESTTTHL